MSRRANIALWLFYGVNFLATAILAAGAAESWSSWRQALRQVAELEKSHDWKNFGAGIVYGITADLNEMLFYVILALLLIPLLNLSGCLSIHRSGGRRGSNLLWLGWLYGALGIIGLHGKYGFNAHEWMCLGGSGVIYAVFLAVFCGLMGVYRPRDGKKPQEMARNQTQVSSDENCGPEKGTRAE